MLEKTRDQPDRQPGGGLKAAIFALFFIIIVLAAVGTVAFVAQLDSLKSELSNSRKELTATKDRIARIERRIDEPAAQSRSQVNRVADPEGEIGSRSRLELSREEVQLLRDYIKVPPAAPGALPTITVGTEVPIGMLMPLPQQVSDKAPKLVGARFTTDRNGAIVIVRPGSRQADAVINPN